MELNNYISWKHKFDRAIGKIITLFFSEEFFVYIYSFVAFCCIYEI